MMPVVASQVEYLVPQRLKDHIQTTSLMTGVSPAQLTGDLPEVMAERLDSPRYRARLERRFLRKARVGGVLPDLLDSPAESIIAHGEHGLQALIIDAGIVCHYVALRQIVDAISLSELSAALGVALVTHDARLAKVSDSLSLAHLIGTKSPDGIEALASAILRDGLQCWMCWIHRQPETVQGFFRQLTPAVLRAGDSLADGGCGQRDCKHRAALFDVRRALVAESDDIPVRRKA